MRQVRARMQFSRKSPGILVVNMTQQCALGSPVHLKPGLNPVKDHQAVEKLEYRIFKGRLRLLGLLSLQTRCFRENLALFAVT